MGEDEVDREGYRFTPDLSGRSSWVGVEGGGLAFPLLILTGEMPDGRKAITGVVVGDGTSEVTASTLRSIRLAEIRGAYIDFGEPWNPPFPVPMIPMRPSGPRGPDAVTLSEFAMTYRAELARQPHRAMTVAARAHNISRATANRWAALCREYGLLVQAGSQDDGGQT